MKHINIPICKITPKIPTCYTYKYIQTKGNINIIQPIFKNGNRNDTHNYRDTSLHNGYYKIYTKIITKQLQ